MKHLFTVILALLLVSIATFSYAGHVSGYTRSNGTYVQGYERSSPNHTKSDNYGEPSSSDRRYGTPASQRDSDGDGIPNRYDSDDDNDGKSDDRE